MKKATKQPSTGSVLISEPFLADPNFSRSVVLITEYEDQGTVGFVLNQKTDYAVSMVLQELDFVHETVHQGGPVELDSFHYIHTYGHIPGATRVQDGLYWTGDFSFVIDGLKNGSLDSKNFKFFVGYSGWAATQLDDELNEKSWILGSLDTKTLFDHTIEDEDLWKHAIRSIGGDDALLANSPIDPYLN